MTPLLTLLLALTAAWSPSHEAACPRPRPLTVTTLCLVNEVREAAGAPRLRLDPRLSRAAARHSRDMVRKHYFSHSSPAGLSPSDRIARSGWMSGRTRWAVGEVLAWRVGRARPDAVVRAWLRSPPHRHVLLNRRYRVVGIGIAGGTPAGGRGRTYTADFGS
jgi:uncharacterized protein YkwD